MRWIDHGPGAASALAAGILFGASTPLAKQLIRDTDPWMLAGLLYLGSGAGLAAYQLLRLAVQGRNTKAALPGGSAWWLAAAILAGGVIAPVLMMYGLKLVAGSSASLLLNLEGVFSVLLAWFVFRESFDLRILSGVVAISAGAVLLSLHGPLAWQGVMGPLAIAAACFAWALDNNFTRKVALNDVAQIAMMKGLVAGGVNVAIAFLLGAPAPRAPAMAAAGCVGLFGYGVSLVLFVIALRHLGAARTAAYFSVAPFVGAAIAVGFYNDPVTIQLLLAGILMGIGLWLHLSEEHHHEHIHGHMIHEHRHVHDAHHQHQHAPGEAGAEPHVHVHTHEPLRHAHSHYPDEHHRHPH